MSESAEKTPSHVAHTPAPWLISSSFLVVTPEARIIARCEPFSLRELTLPIHQCMANAHLIAAAPSYFEGVEEALRPNDGYNCEYVSIPVKAWRMILDAHAKAQGK